MNNINKTINYLDKFDELVYKLVAKFEKLYVYLMMATYSTHFNKHELERKARLIGLIFFSYSFTLSLLITLISDQTSFLVFVATFFMLFPIAMLIFDNYYQTYILKKYDIIRMTEIYDDLYGGLERKLNVIFWSPLIVLFIILFLVLLFNSN